MDSNYHYKESQKLSLVVYEKKMLGLKTMCQLVIYCKRFSQLVIDTNLTHEE